MGDSTPVISFLSDYGLGDDFVGVCHGVIARICPAARVIDLTHGIARHDVQSGALLLAGAIDYLPLGVHLAVVDPDVGAARRAIALRTGDGRMMVGPDNGLLWPAAERAGGVAEAVDIAHSPWRLEPVSATFHGRDLFAPVAAHLATGTALADAGDPLEAAQLVRLELPTPGSRDGAILAHVLHIDRFGNVQLDLSHEFLAQSELRLGRGVLLRVPGGAEHAAQYVRTFADLPAGQLLVYEDAQRLLAVAVSHGDAARRLGVRAGDELGLKPR